MSIPDDKKAHHLFLLVGMNPLPDWVAARVLLKPGGSLYLVHSSGTASVAKDLGDYWLKQTNILVTYIPITKESDGGSVYDAIYKMLDGIGRGATTGLNYTGGTKMMAVHAHRAFSDAYGAKLIDEPVLSYLNGQAHEMIFEPRQTGSTYPAFEVGLDLQTRIDLAGLFSLHQQRQPSVPERLVLGESIIKSLLKLVTHSEDVKEYEDWRKAYLLPILQQHKLHMSDSDLANLERRAGDIPFTSLTGRLQPLAMAIVDGQTPVPTKLGEACRQWGFNSKIPALDFVKFLHGTWLEHYALKCVGECVGEFVKQQPTNVQELYDYGRNIVFSTGKRTNFEIDVALIRGYELCFISCYSGRFGEAIKNKLFEAMIRARQLGGDEARVALVCCDLTPRSTQQELAQSWGMSEKRIAVFGQSDLLTLTAKLMAWLKN